MKTGERSEPCSIVTVKEQTKDREKQSKKYEKNQEVWVTLKPKE